MKYEFRWLQKKNTFIKGNDFKFYALQKAKPGEIFEIDDPTEIVLVQPRPILQYRYLGMYGPDENDGNNELLWSEWFDVPIVEEGDKDGKE